MATEIVFFLWKWPSLRQIYPICLAAHSAGFFFKKKSSFDQRNSIYVRMAEIGSNWQDKKPAETTHQLAHQVDEKGRQRHVSGP